MRNALFGTVITVWSFNSFMRFRNLLLLQFNTAPKSVVVLYYDTLWRHSDLGKMETVSCGKFSIE